MLPGRSRFSFTPVCSILLPRTKVAKRVSERESEKVLGSRVRRWLMQAGEQVLGRPQRKTEASPALDSGRSIRNHFLLRLGSRRSE